MDRLTADLQAANLSGQQGRSGPQAAGPLGPAVGHSQPGSLEGAAPAEVQVSATIGEEGEEEECDYELSDETIEESEHDEEHEAK